MQPAPGLAYRDLRGKCQIYAKLVSQRPQNPFGNIYFMANARKSRPLLKGVDS